MKKELQEQFDTLKTELTGKFSEVKDGANSLAPEAYDVALEAHTGFKPADVEKMCGFTATFVAAAHEVAGNVAIEAMAKDKKLDSVTTTIPLGGFGSQTSNFKRSHTSKPINGEGEDIVTFGVNNAKVEFTAGAQGSCYNAARKAIKSLAIEKLGS